MYYITGDTHRDFKRVQRFCERMGTTKDDVLIILGDAGINYFLDERDNDLIKNVISKLSITLFCVHGNHEVRPDSLPWTDIGWLNDNPVCKDTRTDNLVYAINGIPYMFNGYKTHVIGGAYSVDKHYRMANGLKWFPDEQPSDEFKQELEDYFDKTGWQADIILSHTVPLKYEPIEAFLSVVDQSTVDRSTEEWLNTIEDRLDYKKWYAGHFHVDKKIDKLQIMFESFDELKINEEE